MDVRVSQPRALGPLTSAAAMKPADGRQSDYAKRSIWCSVATMQHRVGRISRVSRGDLVTAKRYIFFGPFSWRFGGMPRPSDSFIVARVPDGPSDVNTVLLDASALAGVDYWHIRCDGAILANGHHEQCVLSGLAVSEDFLQSTPGEAAAPLLVASDSGGIVQFFAQVRIGEHDVLAMWCGEYAISDQPSHGPRMAEIMHKGLASIESNRSHLNKHQRYFWNFEPGIEIEHKLTITSDPDIYGLTIHFRNLVGCGPLSQYIWEYGDDFQQWDFDNHLYEIFDPPEEVGYVSFIPNSRGSVGVKRKWFKVDAIERRERKWNDVTLPGTELEFIKKAFGVKARYLGAFRRTRFDVQMESVATGNIHALMIDRCQFDNQGWPDLCQVEIEYLKSRTLRPSARNLLRAEMRDILEVAKAELDRLGTKYLESPLSKLAYMKQMQDRAIS
jgi:hypothetical protein